MSPKGEATHVGLGGKEVRCLHCGARETVFHGDGIAVGSPAWAGLMAHAQAFEDAHRDCKETDQSPTRKLEADALAWASGLHVGISSATIYTVMMGQKPKMESTIGFPPSDPSDLGRCLRLLRIRPDWRPRLQEVADRFPKWQTLVDHWDEIEALMEEEVGWDWSKGQRAPRTYERMKAMEGR